MAQVTIRFYAELNDFLPRERRQRPFTVTVAGQPTVKDLVESLGVPHTEIELIVVHGVSVDFTYTVREGDAISVYPVFESLDVTPLLRVRPQPLREPRFVLDVHLGRLATYLRMLGFDTRYENDADDPTLARVSAEEHRILLTRDRGLLKRGTVTHGYYVRETNPERQLAEVCRRFDLAGAIAPFSRCLRCNGPLVAAPKATVLDRLPPRVRAEYDEFQACPSCGGVFWQGTHYQRMRQLIARLTGDD